MTRRSRCTCLIIAVALLLGCQQKAARSKKAEPKKVGAHNHTSDNREERREPVFAAPAVGRTPLGSKAVGMYLGTPVSYDNLTIYPISSDKPMLADTIYTIDSAFQKNRILVREEGSGSVPSVLVQKTSDDHIFIMTGEMLIGAKQDRISKHDALLPDDQGMFRLPVYCVEQGRWHGKTKKFKSGKVVGTQKLRKSAVKKMSQQAVWKEVSDKTRQVHAQTSTQAMKASYRSSIYRKESPPYLKRLQSLPAHHPRSIGVLTVINSEIASVDVFANHDLFDSLWLKLLKSFVLDAIDPHFSGSGVAEGERRRFFSDIASARFSRADAPGMGHEYLIASGGVAGTLLVARGAVIHLAAFPEKDQHTRRFDAPAKIGSTPAPKTSAFSWGSSKRRGNYRQKWHGGKGKYRKDKAKYRKTRKHRKTRKYHKTQLTSGTVPKKTRKLTRKRRRTKASKTQ